MGKKPEELFLDIAVEQGLLTQDQAAACRADAARLAEMGYSRSVPQITRDKGFLSVQQIRLVHRIRQNAFVRSKSEVIIANTLADLGSRRQARREACSCWFMTGCDPRGNSTVLPENQGSWTESCTSLHSRLRPIAPSLPRRSAVSPSRSLMSCAPSAES